MLALDSPYFSTIINIEKSSKMQMCKLVLLWWATILLTFQFCQNVMNNHQSHLQDFCREWLILVLISSVISQVENKGFHALGAILCCGSKSLWWIFNFLCSRDPQMVFLKTILLMKPLLPRALVLQWCYLIFARSQISLKLLPLFLLYI